MYIKYPRTPHAPWSPGGTSDDIIISSFDNFIGKEIIITEKLDGECLDGNTQLDTPFGKKTIKEICEDKKIIDVLSFNEYTQENEYQPAIDFLIKDDESKQWYELEVENGISLIVTGDHLVFLPKLNCYRRVDLLTEGDEFIVKN